MANQKKSFGNFIKKNLFYVVLLLVMLVLTGVGVALLINSEPSAPVANITSDTDKNPPASDGGEEKPDDSDNKPTVIVFSTPLENGTMTTAFTENSVIFNKTLQAYTGHMGVDFVGESNAKVLCAYDGTIESITTEYLYGTTVIVKHENGLKTVYNSIDADENLKVGQTVKKGDALGVASDNNKQEYKDGAHLHFEVYENGKRINPEKYLLTDEK